MLIHLLLLRRRPGEHFQTAWTRQVSTTQNIYSHLIAQADTQSAERIADAIFRTEKKLG